MLENVFFKMKFIWFEVNKIFFKTDQYFDEQTDFQSRIQNEMTLWLNSAKKIESFFFEFFTI